MAAPETPEPPSIAALQAQRDAAYAELDELARFLSHDLRAPLRGIDGYSRALLEDYAARLDPAALAYLDYIAESGRLAAHVLDGLIDYIRTPRAALQRELLDLTDLAQEIGERIRRRRAAPATLEAAPNLHALADERLARRLLEALLDNAFKFSAARPDACVRFGALPGAGGAFFVADNGAGYNPAFAERLFRPFERLHGAHEFEGVGLGLAVARRIVERHGGRIWAEGQPNAGATFFFTLQPADL